jgi:hypothetical protein
MMGTCFGCGGVFGFHPHKVPSIRDAYQRKQPICRECVEKANPRRKANGVPEITILPGAYEEFHESELGDD